MQSMWFLRLYCHFIDLMEQANKIKKFAAFLVSERESAIVDSFSFSFPYFC